MQYYTVGSPRQGETSHRSRAVLTLDYVKTWNSYYPQIMEIITISSVFSNMTKKSVMKGEILNILLDGGTGIKNPTLQANINEILGELNPEKEIIVPEFKNTEQTNSNQSETLRDHRETHYKPPSLEETIRKLEAGIEHETGSSIMDTTVGPSTGDDTSPGAYYGLWFNYGDPHTHVLEYKRWKQALKESALTYRAHEIMLEGLREEKEENPIQAFRPWECDNTLHSHYTRATVPQLKKVLKRLTGRDHILTTEIAEKTNIRLIKRNKGNNQQVSVTVPTSGIRDGIDREQSTTSAARRRYINTLYKIMLCEAAVQDGIDPAGAWDQ